MNKYNQEIQDFLAQLKDIGFPDLSELANSSFTMKYKKGDTSVMVGGRVESFLFDTTVKRSRKAIVGADINFRVFTNIYYGINVPSIENKFGTGYQQEERYALEFSNWGTKKQICAEWAIRKPRTDQEAVQYWDKVKNTSKRRVEQNEKEDFRTVKITSRLGRNHLVFKK